MDDDFSDYTGQYEFKEGKKIDLIADENELLAKVESSLYPIYREYEDVFSDVTSEPIYFKRNDSGEVIGYSLSSDGKEFEKLK